MKIVGERLESWALDLNESHEKDLFGRSAFNRYYYSVFLLTREMLGDFDARWKGTQHACIPKLLRGKVKEKVKNRLRRDRRMSKSKKSQILDQHGISLRDLASLLEEAYQVRIIADYEPEISIQQDKNVIWLYNCKLTTAKGWPNRASAYCKAIRKVWEDVGLAGSR